MAVETVEHKKPLVKPGVDLGIKANTIAKALGWLFITYTDNEGYRSVNRWFKDKELKITVEEEKLDGKSIDCCVRIYSRKKMKLSFLPFKLPFYDEVYLMEKNKSADFFDEENGWLDHLEELYKKVSESKVHYC